MKHLSCLVVSLFFVGFAFGEVPEADKNLPKLVSTSETEVVSMFTVDSYDLEATPTPNGEEVTVKAPHSGRIMKKGAPDLVKFATSVIIPDTGAMKVQVVDAKFIELEDIRVAPSKGNLLRTENPDNVPFEYGSEYNEDAFYPGVLADTSEPYIARDFRGQTILTYPFQYNPVTRKLRVYTEMTVMLYKYDTVGENEFLRRSPVKYDEIVGEFKSVYFRHFLNYAAMEREATVEEGEVSLQTLPTPVGRMLIVCYPGFLDNIGSFVTHKQNIGYTVSVVDYSTIGSSAALKTYVANYYNNYGLTYLLLVGDHAQVPTSTTTAGDSDNNYGYIVGNDHYLDIFVGRFSAQLAAHVNTQVNRTIYYESSVPPSASWFRKATGMGSSEGPGHYGEYDYQHVNLILSDLSSVGYTTYTNHQSGGSTANLTNLINGGQGTLWYCGHGNWNGWYCGWNFTNANVAALTNNNMLPAIFSVACQVGNFRNYTCFCEYWLRATNGGSPTGAIAHAGSTINQSWNPPMDAQDEMSDILVSTTGPNRTFGGVFVNGLFEMIDLNGQAGIDMADTWNCFGDSSVQLRTPANPSGPSYCTSYGYSQYFEYISRVIVADLTKYSGSSQYSNFTANMATLPRGSAVNVSLTPAYPHGLLWREYWRIWIDYNQDSDFNDSGELVFSNNGFNTINGTFTVSTSALIGDTRMRISMRWGGYPNSCGAFTWGEVEDYTARIQ